MPGVRDSAVFRGRLVPGIELGGMLKCRREAPGRGAAIPSVALLRRLAAFMPGEISLFVPPEGAITTEEAGEDPGVPVTLPVADRSIDTMLEIESLSC